MEKTLLFRIVYHGRGKMYIIFLWEAWAEDRGKQRPPAPHRGGGRWIRRSVHPRFWASTRRTRNTAPAAWAFQSCRWRYGDGGEDDLPGALVPGQVSAELVDLALCAGHALFDLDDGGGDLPQPLVGQADDGHVVDLG